MVLFLDLDCQNLASLDFGICPISKKDHLISELKISLSEMKLRLQVFPPQSKSIPEVQNIYSSIKWSFFSICPISKKDHLISEMKILLEERKKPKSFTTEEAS